MLQFHKFFVTVEKPGVNKKFQQESLVFYVLQFPMIL